MLLTCKSMKGISSWQYLQRCKRYTHRSMCPCTNSNKFNKSARYQNNNWLQHWMLNWLWNQL